MPGIGAVLRYTSPGPQPPVLRYSVTTPDPPVLTYSVNGGATEAIYGSPEFCLFGYEVEVDGQLVPVSSVSVSLSVRRAIQTWSIRLILPGDGSWQFDNPLRTFAPSLGLRSVAIFGVVQTPAGTFRFQRIEGGVAHDSDITIEAADKETPPRYVEDIPGVCGAGRLDGTLFTADYPRGHGLPASRLVEINLREAGETEFALEADGPMVSLYQPRDTPRIPEAQDLMERLGRSLFRDSDGVWRNPRIGVRGDAALQFDLALRDLQEVRLKVRGDVPTSSTLTADVQVARPADAACGRETPPPVEVENVATFAPRVAGFVVDSGGNLDATGLTDDPAERLRSRSIATVELQCGVVRSERTRTEGFRWREAPRRRWTGSAYVNLQGVYIGQDADAGGGGSEPGYLGPYEEWTSPVTETRVTYFYDHPDWLGPQGDGEPWRHHFAGVAGTVYTSRYFRGSIADEYGWGFRRAALKTRASSTPWDEVDPITDARVRGGGDAVVTTGPPNYFGPELYGRLRRVVTCDHGTDGRLDSRVQYVYGWHHRPGDDFLYAGEASGSRDAFEVFGLVEITTTSYLVQGGRSVSLVTKENLITGVVEGPEITRGRAEDRPELARLPDEAVNLDLYGSPEEAEAARQARPGEVRRAKVSLAVPAALAYHRPRDDKAKVDGVEADEELARMAADILIRGMAIEVSAKTVRPNFQMRPGMWGTLSLPPLDTGAPFEVQMDSLQEGQSAYNEPRQTQVVMTIYPKPT